MIVEAIRVIARRHHLASSRSVPRASRLMTSWISSRVQEFLDPGVNRRHSHLPDVVAPPSERGTSGRWGLRTPPNSEDIPATWAPQVGRVPWLGDEVPFRRWQQTPDAERASVRRILRRLHPSRPAGRPPAGHTGRWAGDGKANDPNKPGPIVSPAERRAAMSSLDATETKWSKGGLAIAASSGPSSSSTWPPITPPRR